MRLTGMVLAGLAVVVLGAQVQAANIHYTFDKTSATTTDVYVEVTGADTSGLSAYSIWVDIDPAGVAYTENRLGNVNSTTFTPQGFQASTLVKGNVGGKFNAGNFQTFGAKISGIGQVPVNEPGLPVAVVLDVPALLGTLTVPAGTPDSAYRGTGNGLLNQAGDGYMTNPPVPTYDVVPEPATLSLLGLAGLALLRRRR